MAFELARDGRASRSRGLERVQVEEERQAHPPLRARLVPSRAGLPQTLDEQTGVLERARIRLQRAVPAGERHAVALPLDDVHGVAVVEVGAVDDEGRVVLVRAEPPDRL